jgi:hypothetical protein
MRSPKISGGAAEPSHHDGLAGGTPMNEFAALAMVVALVSLVVLAQIVAAVLPVIIVVTLVPPEQRDDLARVIAACDSSRKLRIWSTLRLAVKARQDRFVNSKPNFEAAYWRACSQELMVSPPSGRDQDIDRR